MTSPTSPTSQRPLIVLVGAPGAGKSTVGRLLADRVGTSFVDTDQVIAAAAGKPIPEIFVEDGEEVFRRWERTTVLDTLRTCDGVVALGGGAVVSGEIRTALADQRVVWLQVSAAQAAGRVGLTGARPLLMGNVRGRLIALLEERRPLYAEVGDIAVVTDNRPVAEIVDEIIAWMEDA